MIQPYRGKIYDPCCGSGGMFVQSMKFIEAHHGNKKDISVYGQEYTNTTYKQAKMNLTIRGIACNLGEKAADTFHDWQCEGYECSEDRETQLEVRINQDTVWLNAYQIAELFGRDSKIIRKHIANAIKEELAGEVAVANFATTTEHGAIEGKSQTHDVRFYNLDVIISVGYRRWANRVLKYEGAMQVIEELKEKFGGSQWLAHEKDDSFKSFIGQIYQTFGRQNLYPSVEEKAFYDILKSIAKQFGFEYPEEKLLKLAAEIKTIVADKSKYTDWSTRDDIKAELKMDLILILAEYGYPPVTNDEVFKEILEQAENFKKNNG